MEIAIILEPLVINTYGFSVRAIGQDYSGTAFRLSGRTWETVKAGGLKNKGKNIWIYEAGDHVFAGVELFAPAPLGAGLEHKLIELPEYAYYRHTGPYSLIPSTGNAMRGALAQRGLEADLPYVEIYGHWTADEAGLETELIMAIRKPA